MFFQQSLIWLYRSQWRQMKAEKWLTGSVLLATWSALLRPRTACGRCLRWPLEQRFKSASARREAAAHCCEEPLQLTSANAIKSTDQQEEEKKNTIHETDWPFTKWHLCTVSSISWRGRQMNHTQINLIQETDFDYITTMVRNWCLKFLVDLLFFLLKSVSTCRMFSYYVFLYICNVTRQW